MDDNLYQKLAKFCAYRERSNFEVKKKSESISIEKSEVSEYIERLEGDNFLDEERFVRAYCKSKICYSAWGFHKIAYELGRHGLKVDSKQFFEENPDILKEYNDNIQKWIAKKRKDYAKYSEWEQNGKIFKFLTDKGFETENIQRFIKYLDT